ncbi:mechanosensitive ion channel family protein [Methanobacterium alkalithermotolerans]|uniref:Mechanosensitive ion channel family protein n=1 Tax=Methanobacterium alkalithermotolerans TaxID=2731220 RepID=A0A8T8K9P9_9EURY|nr:mechanosensitive ion channel family protein [Methanobacterium alkalithermotolerans]QUH23823.1 mechanosensitive ion channel family protein [Methanobacterium alkalithermotolerans]
MEVNGLIRDIAVIVIIVLVSILIVRWFYFFIKRFGKKFEWDLTVIQVLQDIVKYGIGILALSVILKEIGIDITAIAVSLGIVGVAVGFASRDIISNFISGVLILMDKSFKVGDTIEISNQKGKVTKVGFRTTTITNPNNSVITIPNSSFSKNPYSNYTSMDRRRVDLNVTVSYNTNLEKLASAIEKRISAFPWVLTEEKPQMMIKELSDVGVKILITAWTNDPWKTSKYRSLMAEEIKKILGEENA